jgi:hypothetical protein
MSFINTSDPLDSALGCNQVGLFLCNSQASIGYYGPFAGKTQSLISLGYEQDYFNFQPPANQKGAGYPQLNADLDQFLPDPSLLQPDHSLSFIDARTTPVDLGLRLISPTNQFKLPSMARADAYGTLKPQSPTMELYSSQPKASLENATTGLVCRTWDVIDVQHGRVTTRQSPSTAKASNGSPIPKAENATTKCSNREVDTQDPNRGKKVRRVRRSKKLGVISKEDQQARRKGFLERNRKAAAKCRSRCKQSEKKLKVTVKNLTIKHAILDVQFSQLQHEYDDLQAMLLPHCQVCPAKDLKNWVEAPPQSTLARSLKSRALPLQLNDDDLATSL